MKKLFIFIILLTACQSKMNSSEYNLKGDTTTSAGYASVFQTATSETETTINILRPHLAEMSYEVEGLGDQKILKTTSSKNIYWKVDRIHIKGLSPNQSYKLKLKKRDKVVDWREFKTLNLRQKEVKFAVGSCMADDHQFEHVRNKIWHRMMSQNPDFIMLLGDQVYVDSFDFVKRNKATEQDIWRRYIDSLRKIPLFHMRELKPILATWDDHDYGTNDSDKTFVSQKAADKIFSAFFGGEDIPKVYQGVNQGVFASFDGFGQRFLLMDDRYFREPSKKSNYGHWGKSQHDWFKNNLAKSTTPLWLANGNQFFAPAIEITRKDGSKKTINESFSSDHPEHFKQLMKDLKEAKMPVAFLSGDIHFSEIIGMPKELMGYQTYEVTSSPLHSYIFRSKSKGEEFWAHPSRIVAHKDHNFIMIESQAIGDELKFKATSYGVTQASPFFQKEFKVKK